MTCKRIRHALVALVFCALSLFDSGGLTSAATAATPAFSTAALNGLSIGSIAANRRRHGVTFDNRYGTSTDASGLFTFGLRPSHTRIWVNSTQADDSGNGLTAATAEKTLAAALTDLKALYTFGDTSTYGNQLMIAGTGGRSYTDNGGVANSDFIPGFSATYPTAILSYDPADAANAAKYGHLVGPDRPLLNINTAGGGFLPFFATTYDAGPGVAYIAVQGIHLKSLNGEGAGSVGRHDGLVFQNDVFETTSVGLDNGNRTNGTASGGNISKSAFIGQWDTRGFSSSGNANAVYLDGITGWRVEDNVFIHAGWKVGAARTDTPAAGGPTGFGHAVYYHAGNVGNFFNRNIYLDSAGDGWGKRGSGVSTQEVSWDEPIVGALTGVSGSYTEAPSGDVHTVIDFAAFGGSNLNGSSAGGSGIGVNNGAVGTLARNGVLFDNPLFGVSGNNWLLGMVSLGSGASSSTVLMDKIRAHNWAAVAQDLPSSPPNSITSTWSNSLLDSLNKTTSSVASGTISGTGVRTWTVGDYPSALTADGVATAMLTGMGVTPGASYAARKAQVANYLGDYANLPWAQAFLGVIFPAYGATPTYATAAIPSVSGLATPTAYYTAATPTRLVPGGGGGGSTTTFATQADWTLTNGNLTAERTSATGDGWGKILSSAAQTNGTAIITINAVGSAALDWVGLDVGDGATYIGADSNGHTIGYRSDGHIQFAGADLTGYATYTTGDVVKVVKAGVNVSFYKNNVLQATIDTSSGTYGVGTVLAGAAYIGMSSWNNVGMKATADFSSF